MDNETGIAVSTAYGYLGRRIRKTISENGTTTSDISFIYDGYIQLVALENIGGANGTGATDSITTTFCDPSEQTSTRPLAMRQNGEMFFHVHDLTKNITALVDANGAIVESYDYDAFGIPAIARRASANLPAAPAAHTQTTVFCSHPDTTMRLSGFSITTSSITIH